MTALTGRRNGLRVYAVFLLKPSRDLPNSMRKASQSIGTTKAVAMEEAIDLGHSLLASIYYKNKADAEREEAALRKAGLK
jgi:hypothetical protein